MPAVSQARYLVDFLNASKNDEDDEDVSEERDGAVDNAPGTSVNENNEDVRDKFSVK